MTPREMVRGAYGLVLAVLMATCCTPLAAQDYRAANFLAENYEVSAYLDTTGQTINSIAKVQFRAVEASQILRVQLHENLEVRDVKGADGKAQTVKAKKVVLATGSDARMLPGYQADDTILTNYEILKIAEMPKSLVVRL